MSKIKSFQLLFAAIFCVAIFACSESSKSSKVTSGSDATSETVVEDVEAQTQALENTEKEIEAQIESLDAALNALDL